MAILFKHFMKTHFFLSKNAPIGIYKHLLLFVGLFMAFQATLLAQSDIDSTFRKASTFEIGLNVTSTISAFLGSGSVQTPDPYIFSAKWIKGKHGIRTGLNVDVDNKTEISTDFSGQRDIKQIDLKMRGGYEQRVYISKRLDLLWGVDIVGNYKQLDVDFTSTIGGAPSFLSNKDYSIGTGPVLGVLFHVNKRLALSTESTLYATYTYSQKREYAPPITNASNSDQFKISATLPSSLYLIVKF